MRKGMEPKLIKEENVEKDTTVVTTATTTNNYIEAPRTRSKAASCKDRCKTPDSPEGARQTAAPPSPQESSSPPPRHLLVNSAGAASPINNNNSSSADNSLTPPLPAATALSVNLVDTISQLHQFSQVNNNNGNGSISSSSYARPLVKVKRFLSTLVQFGANDIGPDIGERVKSLVLNLVSSNLSIEEFHHSLQDVTNFPLRPFVLPFLRTHLPLLQREIHALARANKQSPLQYVRSHDHVVLDPAHSPSELSEIFISNEISPGLKRRASDSIYENGLNGQQHSDLQSDYLPLKRPLSSQNGFLIAQQQSLLLPSNNIATINNPTTNLIFDYNNQQQQQQQQPPPIPSRGGAGIEGGENRGDEEWRNIHVMLNCILSMVEKTKRALTILQQRNNQDLTNDWLRKQDVGVDLKRAANEIMLQAVRQTEDRVAEVRRRAEDAVNDVKRQAVMELQKAVAMAETKANELVATERVKMEKLLLDARKHGEDNSQDAEHVPLSPTTTATTSQQNCCWNCGRKAHETCSGCSMARYCGPFCQHKDWENHHQLCSKDKVVRPLRSITPSTTAALATNDTVASCGSAGGGEKGHKK